MSEIEPEPVVEKVMIPLSDVELKKGAADFRLLDRKIVDILINDFNEFHLFYRGLVNWIGFKQIGVDYYPEKRFSGKTKLFQSQKQLNSQ